MQDLILKNAKALIALVVTSLSVYFTPEVISQIGVDIGLYVQAGVVAALTAIMVWLVPNKK